MEELRMDNELVPVTKIAVFRGGKIRKTIHKNEWWFSVVDVIEVLTDSTKPRDYWYAMKTRVKNEDGIELSTNCRQLKLQSSDGKYYQTDCANTEGMLRSEVVTFCHGLNLKKAPSCRHFGDN